MKRSLSLIIILTLPLFADFAKLGTSGAQFLKIGVGRGAAMGEAFVAVSDDASATYWNPAGLGPINNRQVSLQHNEWIADIKHDYLTVALPITNFGTLGISLTALTMGKMEITTVDDPNTTAREDTGTGMYFNASDFAFGLSFGRMFTDKLATGLSIKAVQEAVWDMAANGIALDFGIQYNTGFKGLKIGASMSNFGADINFKGRQLEIVVEPEYPDNPLEYEKLRSMLKTTPYPLPLLFRFGLAFNPVENESQKLTTALDLNHPNDNYETINFGLEYGYLNTIFLRAGYKLYLNMDYMRAMTGGEPVYDSAQEKYTYPDWGENTEWLLNNLTVGVGFNLKAGAREMKIDYAYMNKGILRATHRLGLTIGF